MTAMQKPNHSNKVAPYRDTTENTTYDRKATEFEDSYCNEIYDKLAEYYNNYKTSPDTFRGTYSKQFLEDFAELDFRLSANILGLDTDNINVTDLTDLRDIFVKFIGIINKAEVKE